MHTVKCTATGVIRQFTSSALATTMRLRSGIASLAWLISRAMPRFLVCPLLFEDVLANNATSMRQLVDVSAVDAARTQTLPGLAYGKKYRAV